MKQPAIPGKIIIPSGLMPEKHELETAQIFAALGKNVEFIKPERIKGMHYPDILIDGREWEIKSPSGCSRRTLENNFRKAESQSKNIILDLHRIGISEKIAVSQIKQRFDSHHHKIERIKIITKNNKIIDFDKKS